MADLRDPHSYLWPGHVPRPFVETPPPVKGWKWWLEDHAPNLDDLWPRDGNGCLGVMVGVGASTALLGGLTTLIRWWN